MSSWNSVSLEVTYEILGWFAFIVWSISFYPQVILNFRRKRFLLLLLLLFSLCLIRLINLALNSYFEIFSVVGLNFDFVLLNLTKHSSYLIYNASLYFSSAIQNQYFQKYGYDQVKLPSLTCINFNCFFVQ